MVAETLLSCGSSFEEARKQDVEERERLYVYQHRANKTSLSTHFTAITSERRNIHIFLRLRSSENRGISPHSQLRENHPGENIEVLRRKI
jgi:hypothetical protein